MLPDGRLGACCVPKLSPHHLNTREKKRRERKGGKDRRGGKGKEGGVTHCFCRTDSGGGGGGWVSVRGEKKGPIVAVCHLCDCALDRREGLECTLIYEGTARICRSHSPRQSHGFNKRPLLPNLPRSTSHQPHSGLGSWGLLWNLLCATRYQQKKSYKQLKSVKLCCSWKNPEFAWALSIIKLLKQECCSVSTNQKFEQVTWNLITRRPVDETCGKNMFFWPNETRTNVLAALHLAETQHCSSTLNPAVKHGGGSIMSRFTPCPSWLLPFLVKGLLLSETWLNKVLSHAGLIQSAPLSFNPNHPLFVLVLHSSEEPNRPTLFSALKLF